MYSEDDEVDESKVERGEMPAVLPMLPEAGEA
jgi:hypothetical protein